MRTLVIGTAVFFIACGPGERSGAGIDAAGSGSGSGSDGQVQPPFSRVYAHSGSTLYQVNTATFAPATIGEMKLGGVKLAQSITDLAIDKSDSMVGVTLDKLYAIDETTGALTFINDLSTDGFTSLSFVPDPANANNPDLLVSANSAGEVVRIDATTGIATMIGNYGSFNNKAVVSSGDLIGVSGFGIYATVDVGTEAQDYLARVDPMNNWKATPIGGGTGFDDIFGLAFWEGTIYGFVSTSGSAGKIIKIDPGTGAGTEVLNGAIGWFGAGVATDAPILQ